MIEYILSQQNSFDSVLKEFDHNTKLYAYPVLATDECSLVAVCCKLISFGKDGFYLHNDKVEASVNCPDYLKHTLLFRGKTRFYLSYSSVETVGIRYKFYNKEANSYIYKLLNELIRLAPFEANAFCNNYEKKGLFKEQFKEVYEEQLKKVVREDNVLGFVCCEAANASDKNDIQCMIVMICKNPIEISEYTLLRVLDDHGTNICTNSKYLKNYSSKLLTCAFIYHLQTKYIDPATHWGIYALRDEEHAIILHGFVSTNYDSFSNIEKDMCSYIYSDEFKITNVSNELDQTINLFSQNLGAIVRDKGLVLSKTIQFNSSSIIKQIDVFLDIIDKKKSSFLKPENKYIIDKLLSIILVNSIKPGPLKRLTGIYAYYFLIKLKEQLPNSNLAKHLLLSVYQSNRDLFTRLISKIKNQGYTEEKIEKRFFRSVIIHNSISWSMKDDVECYYELFYKYTNSGSAFILNEEEINFVNPRLFSETSPDDADTYFSEHTSVYHTVHNIENERTFYLNKLESFVTNRIENEKDTIFRDIIM